MGIHTGLCVTWAAALTAGKEGRSEGAKVLRGKVGLGGVLSGQEQCCSSVPTGDPHSSECPGKQAGPRQGLGLLCRGPQ
jgi:hypothetical protein